MAYFDLPGRAIWDYFEGNCVESLFVYDEFGPRSEMPIEMYFREYEEMPELEQIALKHCQGKVLDIGAGAGSHALWLQGNGFDVSALEISPFSCKTMKERGVKNIIERDIFSYNEGKYDTILLLMNGIGLCNSIDGLKKFFLHIKTLMNVGGRLVFDSCDIGYMYEYEEKPKDRYYGEARCKYSYGNLSTEWFQWVYVDKNTLKKVANECGWSVKILAEDDNDQYLAELTEEG